MKKLNFGCGTDYKNGWVNLDFDGGVKTDVAFDINSIYQGNQIPFKDKTFDYIILYDVLEHFIDPLPILRELYRVCKVDGIINIKVPINSWVWDNPQHQRQFTQYSFDVKNFSQYGSQEEEVELIYKKKYILPSRNLLFAWGRWVFKKHNLEIKFRRLK